LDFLSDNRLFDMMKAKAHRFSRPVSQARHAAKRVGRAYRNEIFNPDSRLDGEGMSMLAYRNRSKEEDLSRKLQDRLVEMEHAHHRAAGNMSNSR